MVQEANLSALHFTGDLTPNNDIYRLITGKDWHSREKESRAEPALWLTLTAIPVSKLLQTAKEIRAGINY
ncbi:MAG: pre-toxin TG domain-containing protein [Enterococcus hulanensis]